ncbi:DUF5941 domain-containing protein [Thermostaphylospora chromogena]|uniref:DUF5941 domain-containing protein n=1 Tax=Thermostaphylospora chromogena TaxID=35622 RepID=A0A1H1FQM4_9ACTN|nr:DUF5941 domain-containing protein [Thermostaphylospora chromogena]SDR03211.1 hypothetical protein SAMN04489764_3123 [Thermostaphylospora chromogena]
MITHPQPTVPSTIPDPDEERRRVQTARLLAYRDDGPLVSALRGLVGPGLPTVLGTPLALAAVAAIGLSGMLTSGSGAVMLTPALAMLVFVLPTAARDHLSRFDWLVPPLIRGAEFLAILFVGLAADVPKWLLFVLLYVVGYHTYDTVYRTRQRIWPPRWVFLAGLGWELRLLVICAGAALGAATWTVAALTVYLGVLFASESITSWVRLDKESANASASDDLEQSPEEAQEQEAGDADPN